MSAVTLITDVTTLIEKHGFDQVLAAVRFVETLQEINAVRVGDVNTGVYFNITTQQFRDIGTLSRAGDKIAAIKRFREITNCALQEAKDIVENTTW